MRPCVVAVRRSGYALETPGETLEELIYATVRRLFDGSGLSLADVDNVAIASSDAVDGRAISSMVTAASAGAYARDMVNSSSSGEHALVLACLRILAGRSRVCVVANWAKPSEAPLAAADRLGLDPFFYRPLALERTAFASLQASAFVARTGDARAGDAVAARRSEAAARNERAVVRRAVDAGEVAASPLVAWPLRELHLGPVVDGAVALLVTSEEVARELGRPYAAIAGLGWATDSYWLGDRPADSVPALRIAARAAFARAGVDEPQRELDVAELCDASPFHELMACEALGLDPADAAVNPSGGQIGGWPEFAFGLDRVAEVAERVTTDARLGLAHAAAGFGQQAHSVSSSRGEATMPEEVAIVGVGQTPYRHRYDEKTQPELVREAATAALADAGLTLADVDAVVYSMAPDALIGVMHAERWVADAAGAAGKPMLRVNTGGSTGLTSVQVGHDHVASGLCDCVLVVGADRVGESGDAQTILNRIWEPLYERALPLNTITMLAMQAIRFFEVYGATPEDLARVSVKNHRHGCLNEYAHIRKEVTVEDVLASPMISYPLRLFDCCPQSSGAAATVLANRGLAERLGGRYGWIRGLGTSSETYWMGDRMGPKAVADHAESPALERAVQTAYQQAGVTASDVDVAELYAPFSSTELHAIQDAGLCEKGQVLDLMREGHFDVDGPVPVNPSGGVMCANPIAVTAMVRVIEAALQVTERAGEHQVPGARTALATGVGGDHEFFGAVVVTAE